MPAIIEIDIVHDAPDGVIIDLQYIGGDVSVDLVDNAPETVVVDLSTIGPRGMSAYEVAVANGFVGTEADWLASIGSSGNIDGGVIM